MRSLLGTALRGLRARALLTSGSVLLAVLAVGAAVLGPVFSSAVTNSYGISRLADADPTLTGLTFAYDTRGKTTPERAVDRGVRAVREATGPRFRSPQVHLASFRFDALGGEVVLLSGKGDCGAVVVVAGACPGPGEALLLGEDLAVNELAIGDSIPVDVTGGPAPELRLRISGSYRLPERTDHWFDRSRLASQPRYVNRVSGVEVPYRPAPLLVDAAVFDRLEPGQWYVRLDSRLAVAADWTEAERSEAVAVAESLGDQRRRVDGGWLTNESINQLRAIDDEVAAQQEAAGASIAPAVLSLVLIALALLLRLFMAAADLRAPELALASLRGVSRRRMWVLGLAEPVLVLAIAVPLGMAAGFGGALLLTRAWLYDDLPLPVPWSSIVAGPLVGLAALAVSAVAVALVLRETLASQLAGVRRPGGENRLALAAQLLVVALAVTFLLGELGQSGPGDPDLTDLFLPVLLAVAAGLLTTRATSWLARWWTRHRGGTRSLAGFVSSRALSRRTEGTLVILPLTAAIAIGVFAAGVHDSAADWRHSVAATEAPADVVWSSPMSFSRTVEVTHELDPDGEYLMAAATTFDPEVDLTILDAPRLPRVAVWPEGWTPGRSVEEVTRALTAPADLPRVEGTEVSVAVDNQVVTSDEVWLELRLAVRGGQIQRVYAGPLRPGTGTASVRVDACAVGCDLRSVAITGRGGLSSDLGGTLALRELSVDGEPVSAAFNPSRWALGDDPRGLSASSRLAAAPGSDDALLVTLPDEPMEGTARLLAGAVPVDLPVLLGVDGDGNLEAGEDGGTTVPLLRSPFPLGEVIRAESVPFLGPAGALLDHAVLTADRSVVEDEFTTYVLAREDTPDDVREALLDRGLFVVTTLAAEQATLDNSAHALALRLYAVVAVLVLLMALAGLVVSTAVQLPARRADAAALRVVGVRRRVVMSTVVREFLVVLGGAAVAGVAAGSLAQYVVLRTLTLGHAEERSTPAVVAALDGSRLLVVALVAAVVLGTVAVVMASMAVRGARGATLRESTR